jgi:hypothetical protein
VEKVESRGRIGDQALEGIYTTYSLQTELNLITKPEVAQVPATNVDLVDLQKTRDRESTSLMAGAVLGVAGALIVELLLAAIGIVVKES